MWLSTKTASATGKPTQLGTLPVSHSDGATAAREPKTPHVVELLRKAIEWRRQLDAGEVLNQAAIAHREGITRARVTQIMGMLRLAPAIQEHILVMTETALRISERVLRPIARLRAPESQMVRFAVLCAKVA